MAEVDKDTHESLKKKKKYSVGSEILKPLNNEWRDKMRLGKLGRGTRIYLDSIYTVKKSR